MSRLLEENEEQEKSVLASLLHLFLASRLQGVGIPEKFLKRKGNIVGYFLCPCRVFNDHTVFREELIGVSQRQAFG
jgi:hypothetical protein